MCDPLPRFTFALNLRVIRMTRAEADEAQKRYDTAVQEATASGALNATNYPWVYQGLWAGEHYGADAVEVVPDDGTLLAPLTHRANGQPIEAPPATTA